MKKLDSSTSVLIKLWIDWIENIKVKCKIVSNHVPAKDIAETIV